MEEYFIIYFMQSINRITAIFLLPIFIVSNLLSTISTFADTPVERTCNATDANSLE